MKKCLIIAGMIIILIALLFYGCGFFSYIPELSSRLARYHNHGEISLFVDGEQVTLDQCPITMGKFDFPLETSKIKNNSFRFKTGTYGTNEFHFEVLGVNVDFGIFNTNWWHVLYYDIELHLMTNGDGTIDSAILRQTCQVGKTGTKYESESSVTFDGNEKRIQIMAGP
ncbi:MAG: hypothetical protein E7399_01380 [Ruminococcaceae bacterium]|nr:hypothetical protein [Oscillospiraceae bacterium]